MLGFHADHRGEPPPAGRHRIVSQLGQGGSADVYLAVADGPNGFQKLVVLKVLKQALRGDRELREMFLREARLAARLQHPHIVQTNEVLEIDGTPILVMEYLRGQPLTEVIVRGRQPPHQFTLPMQLRVLIDALNGLHAAHELTDFDGRPLGVVHRDVSPHNLFVTVEGQAKVLDFGIAKLARAAGETTETGTEVGTIKGKLRYMAPEQLAGDRLDRRADLYAAGVILWEALAGERMWKGCSEPQIRARVQSGDLPLPDAGGPAVPGALLRICRRALALAVDERYPTALELADDLEGALAALGGDATRRAIGATVTELFRDVQAQTREAIERVVSSSTEIDIDVPPTAQAASPPAPVAEARPRAPRRRLWLALAGGASAFVALLVLVAPGVWQGGAGSSATRAPLAATVVAPGPAATPAAAPGLIARDEPAAAATLAATAPGAAPGPHADNDAARSALPRTGRPRGAAAASRAALRASRPATVASAPAGDVPPASVPRADVAPANSPPANSPPARPAAPPAAARDCDQPFFVDADGIKRFRPECM